MGARKTAETTIEPRASGSWSLGTLTGIALLVGMLVGGVYAWRIWGARVEATANKPLTLERLHVSPLPEWIRADVRTEAFRDGSLGQLSLFEKDVTYKVYRAFEVHAWVAKVNRVIKAPDGGVMVDVLYRRPVAWVEIPGRMSPTEEAGVLPIDHEAVILPPEDLQGRIGDFIRISIPELPPWGLKGTPWGDARLVGAARLAALLEGCWQALQIHRIRALTGQETGNQPDPLYELITRSGQRILWGSAPGSEKSGEASAQQKILHLKHLVTHGLTDGANVVDLRVAAQPQSAAR